MQAPFSTRITRTLGLTTPIINAGMAMIARPELAAAVAEAGGFGTIACDVNGPEGLRDLIHRTRSLTRRPIGVDLIGDFATDGHVDVLVEEKVEVAIFFWSPPGGGQIARLKAAKVRFWMQVGSVAEARRAVDLGAEALIVQGAEAGGHNRSEAATMTLFPRLRRLLPDLPLIAAGGIVDGTTMAAALVLGADAVWCGTRFLASIEANAHSAYKARVVAADVGDSVRTTVYGPEWPGRPMRAIVNGGLRRALEQDDEAMARHTSRSAGTVLRNGERVALPCQSAILPTRDFEGDIEETCLTAGESAGNVRDILPARTIVRTMTREAVEAFARFASVAAMATPGSGSPQPSDRAA
ncbi:MAG: nitronate monooxygenase [Azospirillaceae bacterium]